MRFESELIMEFRFGFQWRWQLNYFQGFTEWSFFHPWETFFSDNHNHLSLFFWSPLKIDNILCLEGGGLPLSSLFWYLETNIVSLPKPIWVFRIMEYSTISLLNYFRDTLAYVVLPCVWFDCDSNKYLFILNRGQIKLGNMSWVESENLSQIRNWGSNL